MKELSEKDKSILAKNLANNIKNIEKQNLNIINGYSDATVVDKICKTFEEAVEKYDNQENND